MAAIQNVRGRQILDSRGNPTVEVEVKVQGNIIGRAQVPSGASTGIHEALELRDGNPSVYKGKGVEKAVAHINGELGKALVGKDVTEQKSLDEQMIALDGTENKGQFGANAILGISLAAARAGALLNGKPLYRYLFENLNAPSAFSTGPGGARKMSLPLAMMNIVNGGAHASNNLDIQEFMVMPHLKGKVFKDNLRAGVEIFHTLKDVLKEKGHSTNVGDEGGFAPNLKSHDECLDLIMVAIERAGYRPGDEVSLTLDAASSEFFKGGVYKQQGRDYSIEEMVDYYRDLAARYPIVSIEDGLAEEDWKGWSQLTAALGKKVMLVGDDLFVTNKKILKRGIEGGVANSILVKLNQIGTLSETFDTLDLAFKNKYKAIISHRSGETSDSFIADLAVATGAGYIKTGSLCRTDRTEKYNQLLRIEEDLLIN